MLPPFPAVLESRNNTTLPDSIHSENSYWYSSQLFVSADLSMMQAHVPRRNYAFLQFLHQCSLKDLKHRNKLKKTWTVLHSCLKKMQKIACYDRFQSFILNLSEFASAFFKLWNWTFSSHVFNVFPVFSSILASCSGMQPEMFTILV